MVAPKTIQDDDRLLNPTEVADKLGVHRSTVHNWLRDGMMESERHGTFHGVPLSEVDRFSLLYSVDDAPAPVKKAKAAKVAKAPKKVKKTKAAKKKGKKK